jgi:peptidoglycan pentaglycine glycine transferase (the first glycine)
LEEPIFESLAGSDLHSGFMQSAYWSRFKQIEGYEVTRLGLREDRQLIGGASLLRFHLTGEPTFVLCPEGPVLPWEDSHTARSALRQLIDFAKTMPNTLGLRIEPHLQTPLPSILRNSGDAPTDLTPSDTLMIDLRLTEEELLARAHPKCRYNIRIAEREGVQVSRSQDLSRAHDFYELLTETSFRTGFFVEPFGFFLNLLSTVFGCDAGELFTASHQGKLLAAILVVYFGRRATYLYGASSSTDRQKMPAYSLHRAAMGQARNRGCLEYDMYGIDAFERRDHLYAGITRFKKQWGGEVHRRIGARDFVFYDRLADLIVEKLS